MTKELYLFWIPDGWAVFSELTCPDPHGLPAYWYKKYDVTTEQAPDVFEKLLEVQQRLRKGNVIPSRENYDQIFPNIDDLLESLERVDIILYVLHSYLKEKTYGVIL